MTTITKEQALVALDMVIERIRPGITSGLTVQYLRLYIEQQSEDEKDAHRWRVFSGDPNYFSWAADFDGYIKWVRYIEMPEPISQEESGVSQLERFLDSRPAPAIDAAMAKEPKHD